MSLKFNLHLPLEVNEYNCSDGRAATLNKKMPAKATQHEQKSEINNLCIFYSLSDNFPVSLHCDWNFIADVVVPVQSDRHVTLANRKFDVHVVWKFIRRPFSAKSILGSLNTDLHFY